MRHLCASVLLLFSGIAFGCGGDTSHDDPWRCAESGDHAYCRCNASDEPLDQTLQPVASCAKFECCYAYTNGDCLCLSNIIGQPLQECGLVQIPDGVQTEACPPR